MATLRQQIEQDIATLKAEVAYLETQISTGGDWLDAEIVSVMSWLKGVWTAIKGKAP